MNNDKYNMMKYIGAAAAVGGSFLLGTGLINNNKSIKKKIKKTAGKALDAFDGIMNGMQNILN